MENIKPQLSSRSQMSMKRFHNKSVHSMRPQSNLSKLSKSDIGTPMSSQSPNQSPNSPSRNVSQAKIKRKSSLSPSPKGINQSLRRFRIDGSGSPVKTPKMKHSKTSKNVFGSSKGSLGLPPKSPKRLRFEDDFI